MEAKIIKTEAKRISIQMDIELSGGMLESEEAIQRAVNQAGLLVTQYALSQFDTDGSSIEVEGKKYTSKGQLSKTYQCPYGEFVLYRHVYQSNEGGSTYSPLDSDARILRFSTPKFAQMVSHKYSQTGALQVHRDLKQNHARTISRTFIQDISDAVGEVALSKPWKYATCVAPLDVSCIAFSLDGTCMLLREDGWRQAMVGSISFYNHEGERVHTIYHAQAPEYGKETFLREFTKEIETVKKSYPGKRYVGVADGAADNWKFLQPFVDVQVLDFFHVSEYLAKVSKAAFKQKTKAKTKTITDGKEWLKQSRHTLKHEIGGAEMLLKEMEGMRERKLSQEKKEEIDSAITYFRNHLDQMNYPTYLSQKIPIGSGVIEAACKVIIKQRMCSSGMRWNTDGAKHVLVLRCFSETDGKWNQFWNKISSKGY